MAGNVNNWVCEPNEEVTVKVGKEGLSALPRTIPDLFKESCSKFGSNKMLNVKREGKWESITVIELYVQCMRVAKSLVAIGLKRFEGVSIMGFNSPEWMMADIGTIMAGGLATGIYTTNNVETTKYILENSRSRIVIGEHSLILAKLLEAGKGIEGLKFVQFSPAPVEQSQKERGVISWDEFLQLGKDVKTEEIETIMSTQKPGHCSTLVYTSGTTGMPKGTMLSHDNLIWVVAYMNVRLNFKKGHRLLSYLPFSHVLGHILDFYSPLITGCVVYFAEPDVMSGSLLDSLKEVEPNIFLGVPRVWEMLFEKVQPDVRTGKLLLEDVAKTIGLSKSEVLMTAGAITPLELLKLFDSAKLPIYNLYGCTEVCGPISMCVKQFNKYGSVGKPTEGCELKIDKPDSDGEGHILIRGRYLFMGYLRNPEKTAEVMNPDGFYQTGDIGRVDSEGYLWITGRIKEMLVVGTGQNVAPVPIEMEMKKELKLCAFCVVVGEAKEYFNLLVTVKSKLSPEGTPTNELDEEAVGICKNLGVELSKVTEVMENPVLKQYIQEGINRANERAMNHLCLIKDFAILPNNFTINTGELTPTAKLKRSFIIKKYTDVIDKMYF